MTQKPCWNGYFQNLLLLVSGKQKTLLSIHLSSDTIVIPYRNKKYVFNVLEVRPGSAIQIIDSDITTEFAPPLTGENPFTQTTFSSVMEEEKDDKEEKGSILGRMNTTLDGVEGVDYTICENCRHKIPINSSTNHSLACFRMNWFCQLCGEVFQKSKKDEHMKEFHTKVFCECGIEIENRFLINHKKNDCPKRIVRCEYCPLEMPYNEKFEHEKKCGAQTEKCDRCKKYIQKKDYPIHVVTCQLPIPPPRRNFFGINSNKRSGEEEFICPVCYSPFIHLDDLQVHMFEHGTENEIPQEQSSEKIQQPQSMEEDENFFFLKDESI